MSETSKREKHEINKDYEVATKKRLDKSSAESNEELFTIEDLTEIMAYRESDTESFGII